MSSDFHVHSHCSPDSSSKVDQVIEAAVNIGLEAVAITDHAEMESGRFGFVSPNCRSSSRYKQIVYQAARQFEGNIKTLIGVEVGYNMLFEPQIRSFLRENRFDIVIGSVHSSPPIDLWDRRESLTLKKHPELGVQALLGYFTQIEHAAASGLFNVIAHIDIYERFLSGMWPNPFEHPSLVSVVKKAVKAIAEHSRMEINLSMLNHNGEVAWSALPFLEMYKDMGGKPPTVGSDAHRLDWVGLHVQEGEALAYKAGFTQVATWKDIVSFQ